MDSTALIAVSEIFHTIQGEATYTGTSSIFVRLQFCDVGCPWCDTKYTWHTREHDQELELSNTQGKYTVFTAHRLYDEIMSYAKRHEMPNPHVVFTGGEPCKYDLEYVTTQLNLQVMTTQIETSGTYDIKCSAHTWVTVSPKIDMPGGRKVLTRALKRANEIKMPVGKQSDIDKLIELLDEHGVTRKPTWLQPLSRSKKATELCVDACRKHGFKLSIQTHQLIGLP